MFLKSALQSSTSSYHNYYMTYKHFYTPLYFYFGIFYLKTAAVTSSIKMCLK